MSVNTLWTAAITFDLVSCTSRKWQKNDDRNNHNLLKGAHKVSQMTKELRVIRIMSLPTSYHLSTHNPIVAAHVSHEGCHLRQQRDTLSQRSSF